MILRAYKVQLVVHRIGKRKKGMNLDERRNMAWRLFGIEKEKEYYDICVERLNI